MANRRHTPTSNEVSTETAAQVLGVSSPTVRKLCQTGALTASRLGPRSHWRINIDSLASAWRTSSTSRDAPTAEPKAQEAGIGEVVGERAGPAVSEPEVSARLRSGWRLPKPRCYFCGKPALQTVMRMLPNGAGELEESEVYYCGQC